MRAGAVLVLFFVSVSLGARIRDRCPPRVDREHRDSDYEADVKRTSKPAGSHLHANQNSNVNVNTNENVVADIAPRLLGDRPVKPRSRDTNSNINVNSNKNIVSDLEDEIDENEDLKPRNVGKKRTIQHLLGKRRSFNGMGGKKLQRDINKNVNENVNVNLVDDDDDDDEIDEYVKKPSRRSIGSLVGRNRDQKNMNNNVNSNKNSNINTIDHRHSPSRHRDQENDSDLDSDEIDDVPCYENRRASKDIKTKPNMRKSSRVKEVEIATEDVEIKPVKRSNRHAASDDASSKKI